MKTEKELLEIALTSPALEWQSDKKSKFAYPSRFEGRVPLKVKMEKNVKSDLPTEISKDIPTALEDNEYYCWVNSYGALAVIFQNGKQLGLVPNEFIVTEWHHQ